MSIDNSALFGEMEALLRDSPLKGRFKYGCQIMTPDEIIEATTVEAISIERDFENNYSDITTVTFTVPAGTYIHRIYPNRHSLKLKLVQDSIGENNQDFENTPVNAQVFNATLLNLESVKRIDAGMVGEFEDVANRAAFQTVTVQLTDMRLEPLLNTAVNGIFHKVNVSDLLRVLLRGDHFVGPNDETTQGVDLVEADNTRAYRHIIVDPDVRLLNLPDFLQEKYGVYNEGIGYYLDRGLWYVYPLYNLKRYTSAVKTMNVISLPPDRFPSTERSYLLRGDSLLVAASGKTIHGDSSELVQREAGNGLRMIKSSQVMDKFSKTENGKTHINRKDNITEFVGWRRPGTAVNIHYSDRKATDNHFAEMSKLSPRNGERLSFVWQNSDPNLITPGMPVRYYYRSEGEVVMVEGVILSTVSQSAAVRQGMLQNEHSVETAITLLLHNE